MLTVSGQPALHDAQLTAGSPRELRQPISDKLVVYLGIDPTARSLHVGHLVPLMTLLHFHLRGATPIALARSLLLV